jgi:hypothetical protein
MRRAVSVSLLACSLAAASLFVLSRVSAQEKEPNQNQMPDLVGELKKTPGVLGVDAARTMSGKYVIFAWFENKKAVVDWYYSPTHMGVMKAFAGPGPYRKPLEHVKDDKTPILVIASLTMAEKPKFAEIKLPVSQIAIELYQPTPGGAALGGRFAPQTVKVENLVEHHMETIGKVK